MSVLSQDSVKVMPIFRQEGFVPVERSIIARWYGLLTILGDGSGGVYFISFNLYTVVNLFGAHTLWDCKWVNYSYSAPLVVPYGYWLFRSGEPVNAIGGWLEINQGIQNPGNYQALLHDCIPCIKDMKFPFQYQQPQYPAIVLTMGPNTVGVTVQGSCGGFVYDERLI